MTELIRLTLKAPGGEEQALYLNPSQVVCAYWTAEGLRLETASRPITLDHALGVVAETALRALTEGRRATGTRTD